MFNWIKRLFSENSFHTGALPDTRTQAQKDLDYKAKEIVMAIADLERLKIEWEDSSFCIPNYYIDCWADIGAEGDIEAFRLKIVERISSKIQNLQKALELL